MVSWVLRAVYLGFLGISVAGAEALVKRGGYYVLLAAFALFLHALWRLWHARPDPSGEPLTPRQALLVAGPIGSLSLPPHHPQPLLSKILHERFVLQSPAFYIHHFHHVAV